ncbi:MAG: TonB-dependent receptor domain-containing protein, partial [Luteolibacter sp.]
NENGDSNARLRIIHGTRAGGISYAHSLGLIQPYDPESDTMLELSAGIKPQPDFTFTASLFQSWIRDQQIPFKVPGGLQDIDTLVTNAARSRRRGVTLASIWQPLEGLIFSGNLAWTHTEFTSFDDEGINRSGQMFPNVPEWTASLAASYRHSSGWFGNLRASRADSSYSDLRNPEKSALESRELLSARLGYGWDHCSVYLFGNNLLDDQYLLQRADNTSSGLPPSGLVGPPRMLGVGAEFRW